MIETLEILGALESSYQVVLIAIFGIVAGKSEVAFSQTMIGPLCHIKLDGS